MPIVADAAAAIRADMSGFNRDLQAGGDKAVKGLGEKIKGVFSPRNLAIAGVAGGVAIAGAITAGLSDAVKALIDIERLNAQTDAVLKSTGGAANVTREQIEEAAEAAERATTIEREAVQGAQNLLLTFTRIKNQAGEGNDIFDQATEAVLDMSVAMGTDANTAAMQLGKALNDPVKGMSQLGRAGVQFTEEQQNMVKALVETGDVLGAQKIILEELETQFGGSAEAFANTTAGKIQRFQNDVGNMFESIILGAVKVGEALTDDPLEQFAMNFGEQGDRVHDIADRFGQDFDDLKARIEARMDETGESFTDATDHIESEMEGARLATRESAWEMMQGITSSIHDGSKEVEREFKRIAKMPGAIMREEYADIRMAAYQSQVEYAKGLLDAQDQPRVAMDALVQYQKETLSNSAQVAYLMGLLNSEELAAGLIDSRPLVNAQARATREAIINQLKNLGAYSWGFETGTSFAAGMNAAYGYVRDAAGNLAAATRNQIGIESEPKGHDSPLRGITKWGGNIVKTIADGIYGELGTGSNAANALAGVLVPNLGMPALATATPSGVAPSVGPTYIVNVNGVQRTIKSEEEAMQALRDLGAFTEGRLG